jgi:hypothetical protein
MFRAAKRLHDSQPAWRGNLCQTARLISRAEIALSERADIAKVNVQSAFSMREPETSHWKVATLLFLLVAISFVPCALLWMDINAAEGAYLAIFGDPVLPMATAFCLRYKLAVLLMPAPWLAAAVALKDRKVVSNFAVLVFVSTLFLALISTSIFVLNALLMPMFPLTKGMESGGAG